MKKSFNLTYHLRNRKERRKEKGRKGRKGGREEGSE
jgi:hypothetical protein